MIWSSNCFSNMTVTEKLEYLYDKLESLDPSTAPDLTEVKQRLANVEADIRRLDREIDDIDLSGINDEIEAINNQLQSITDAQNTQAANIAALQSGKQDKLTAGDNITLTSQADGTVKISSTGGGGGGGSVTVDGTVTQDGTNPVTGAGIYQFVHDITDPMGDDLDDIAQDIVDLQNANTTTSQTIAGLQTTQQQQTTDIQQLQTSDQQQDSDIGANRDKIAQHDTDIQQLQSDLDAAEVNINAIFGDYVKESVYTPFAQQTNTTITEHTQQITDLQDDKQNKLVAGDNITLDPQTDGTVKISSTASGGGGGGDTGSWVAVGRSVSVGRVGIQSAAVESVKSDNAQAPLLYNATLRKYRIEPIRYVADCDVAEGYQTGGLENFNFNAVEHVGVSDGNYPIPLYMICMREDSDSRHMVYAAQFVYDRAGRSSMSYNVLIKTVTAVTTGDNLIAYIVFA